MNKNETEDSCPAGGGQRLSFGSRSSPNNNITSRRSTIQGGFDTKAQQRVEALNPLAECCLPVRAMMKLEESWWQSWIGGVGVPQIVVGSNTRLGRRLEKGRVG
jgi:hypothetical protein